MPNEWRPQTWGDAEYISLWPELWEFKPLPNDRIRELVKAGALIVAELDRLLAL